MSLRPLPARPSPEIERSTDTPAARVDWHLACMKAKSLGLPLPPPPWETPQDQANRRCPSPSDPFKTLSIPRRPKQEAHSSRKTPETKRATPKEISGIQTKEKHSQKAAPKDLPPVTKTTGTLPPPSMAVTSRALPVLPTRSVLTFPQRPMTITLASEKREAVAALLLRAGVPKKILMTENRSQAVIDHVISYLKEPTAQTLHKYNLGRQFVIHGGIGHINKTADVILPLLLATTPPELATHIREAEQWIQSKVLPLNMPGPKVAAPSH